MSAKHTSKAADDPTAWQAQLKSHAGFISWLPEQYIANVGINGHVLPAMMDTGGEKSMVCTRVAELLGLHYSRARGSEFGKYVTTGGHVQPYFGLIRGPIDVRFSADIMMQLKFLKVVKHGKPLLLLGADLMRGGRPTYGWNWQAIGARTLDVGKV